MLKPVCLVVFCPVSNVLFVLVGPNFVLPAVIEGSVQIVKGVYGWIGLSSIVLKLRLSLVMKPFNHPSIP
jgi:hypothetical protein